MNRKSIINWLLILILVGYGVFLGMRYRNNVIYDNDFEEFKQSCSEFYVVARSVIPWETDMPNDATMSYEHKSMADGREYIEIKILYTALNNVSANNIVKEQARIFAQTNVQQPPYYCVEEEQFQIDGTVFLCYTFDVSKTNQEPASFYGMAFGYNEHENSVVYVFFTDEELSFSEPGYLLSKFYPD